MPKVRTIFGQQISIPCELFSFLRYDCSTALVAVAFLAISLTAAAQMQALGFGQPIPLNSNAESDEGVSDFRPSLATDDEGKWVVVWRIETTINANTDDKPIYTSRSADNGNTWSEPQGLGPSFSTDIGTELPVVATNRAGIWIALWTALRIEANLSIITGLSVSADAGGTWSDPREAPISGFNLRLVPGSDTTWFVASTTSHFESPQKHSMLARSSDNGQTWARLDFPSGETLGAAAIDTDNVDTWVSLWPKGEVFQDQGWNRSDMMFARSTDNGVTWTAPLPFDTNAPEGTFAGTVTIATDGAGNWVALWNILLADGSFDFVSARMSRSSDNGATWRDPESLPLGPISDLATDASGNWLAVLLTRDAASGEGTLTAALSVDNGETWQVHELITLAGGVGPPDVEVGKDQRWIIAFATRDDINDSVGADWDILAITSDRLTTNRSVVFGCSSGDYGDSLVLNKLVLADLLVLLLVLITFAPRGNVTRGDSS